MKYLFSFTTDKGYFSLVYPYSVTLSYSSEERAIKSAIHISKRLLEIKKGNGYYSIMTWLGPDEGYQAIASGNTRHTIKAEGRE
jgi:hypothetical protein